MYSPRAAITATASVLLAPLLVVPLASSAAGAAAPPTTGPLASSIAVAWQRMAIRTIYADGPQKAPPEGALYLAFTSLAVHEAAREAQKRGTHAAAAAVATAAHDVLIEYFPASSVALNADLDASLAMVPDGKKEDAGVSIGAHAAAAMIASRVNDGRNDAVTRVRQGSRPGDLAAVRRPGWPCPGSASSSRSSTWNPSPSTAPTH